MLNNVRYSVLASTWHPYHDRFLGDSAWPKPTPAECIAAAAAVPGITGVELIHPAHVTPANLAEIKAALTANKLAVASVAASISGRARFLGGSLTADDPAVRREAMDTVMTAMDLSSELGAGRINLWLGRDGFDYAFQMDYDLAWRRLVEALQEIAAHRRDVAIGIEYKLKEPRRNLLAATAAKTLLLIKDVGAPNLGVLLDTGHALHAGESLGETVALLARAGKLFHVHFNDNTRLWDDDMIVGSVHFLEIMEMLYWLDRTGYQGWLSFDPHPINEDPSRCVVEGLRFVQGLIKTLEAIGRDQIEAAIASHQVTSIMEMVGEALFGDRAAERKA